MNEDTEIRGDIRAALTDVIAGTLQILIKLGLDEYGPIDLDTGIAVSAALGDLLADVMERAERGMYS